MKINLLLVALSCCTTSLCFADFKGNVVAIRDGGSVIVQTKGQDVVVKLNSIVTPYPNQNLYAQSRIVAERIFMGRPVNVITNDKISRGGCVYGELVSDGINLNEALLMTGYAWLFNEKEASEHYRQIQNINKNAKKGLFDPDNHFQFNAISFTPNYFFRECLAKGVKVPLEEQSAFVAESEHFGFGYSVRSVIIGVLMGILLLLGLFYVDRLGLDLDLAKHFKRKGNVSDDFK